MTARRRAAKRSRSNRKKKTGGRRAGRAPARKPAARKGAKATRGKATGRKTAARGTSPLESLVRRMIRATQDPSQLSVADLYAENAVSREAAGEPAVGIMALEAKLKTWESMQDSSAARWKARNVFTRGNTICIEWEADLRMRDGRRVVFREVAVHEVRGGKIVSERYYYDPSSLAPPAST